MVQSVCRLWNLCAIGVSVLCIYNILVTLKLMYHTECTKNFVPIERIEQETEGFIPPHPCEREQELMNLQKIFNNMDLQLGRWDNRRMYKFFDNVIVGTNFAELNEQFLVTLATQGSLDKLISLIQVAKHWNGPISVAVFAVGDDELTRLLHFILYLRQCFLDIQQKVTFHFAFPKDHIPSAIELEPDNAPDCTRPEQVHQSLIKEKPVERWRVRLPYPQNHMRNLARKNCQTKFVFLTDVDIIPSLNMAEGLHIFVREHKCNGKCAYVIPTYEVDERLLFPANKSELVRLAKKNLARPFHHKVFIYNQYATNFTRWQSSVQESQDVHISHPVTNFEFLYEPFYVAPDNVPPHDERFVGYGYTRNTQVYEMFVAGYEFLVLSPVFTCHWGLQVKRSRPAWREHQNSINRKQFETFKQEVFARYNKDPLNMIRNKPHT